jgi:hypothetical protein
LPESFFEALAVFQELQVTGLAGEPKSGGLCEEIVDAGGRELGEGFGTSPELAVGLCVERMIESIVETIGRDDEAGDLASVAAPSVVGAMARFEDHVEDDVAKAWVLGVAMELPVAAMRIEFQGADELLPVELDRGVEEIRSGRVIPLTELNDAQLLVGGGGELPAKGPAKPERLELHLGGRRSPSSATEVAD